jgi:hypothetical protein
LSTQHNVRIHDIYYLPAVLLSSAAARTIHSGVNQWLEHAHVLQHLTIAPFDAMVNVKPILKEFILGVEFVQYRVSVLCRVDNENAHSPNFL